jgi:hypothetical protein
MASRRSPKHAGRSLLNLAIFAAPLALIACHSAGPFGHSKVYDPTDAERAAVSKATEYDVNAFARSPEKWRERPIWLFGIVTNRGLGPGGAAYTAVSIRSLQLRNLCEKEDEDSCRVTVSEREYGTINLLLNLAGEDDRGELSVGPGSLVRVVGTIGQDADPVEGVPIMRVSFYRHWPRGFFVTTKAAAVLRR